MVNEIHHTWKENRSSIRELIEKMIQRPDIIVPVVGAGLSIPMGMPGWRGFLEEAIQWGREKGYLTSSKCEAVRSDLDQGKFEEVITRLYEALSKTIFNDLLQEKMRLRERPIVGAIRWIPCLTRNLIITTNYDQVIESVWKNVECLLPSNSGDFQRALTGQGRLLLKLHGDIESPDTWILTKESFDELYNRSDFRSFLKTFFKTHFPLFIGSSLQEDRLFEEMKTANCMGFAIMAFKRDVHFEETVSRLKDVVRVIWLRPEDLDESSDIYALLDPLLSRIVRFVQHGYSRPQPNTSTERPPWSTRLDLDALEKQGKYKEGITKIWNHWNDIHGWSAAIRVLRFTDYLGDPEFFRQQYDKVQENTREEASKTSEESHAVRYYLGRFYGQGGQMQNAIAKHGENVPREGQGLGDYYQIHSRFEIGNIYFRVEDYDRARGEFEMLKDLLEDPLVDPPHGEDSDYLELTADVYKFLATIEVLHLVCDYPHSPWTSIARKQGDAEKCLQFAKSAQEKASTAKYADGEAWAHTVAAFGLEASNRFDEAQTEYETATAICTGGGCRESTLLYICIYLADFRRRREDFPGSACSLECAESHLPKPIKVRYLNVAPRLWEARSLLAHCEGKTDEEHKYFQKALREYGKDPVFSTHDDWPLVKRLWQVSTDMGIDFCTFCVESH